MKNKVAVVLMGVLVLLAASARAQPGQGQGGRGGGIHYGMMWDASAITTRAGEVTGVETYTPGKGGRTYGLRLILKTDKATLPVILGPGWYTEPQHFAFAPRDQVEIKGSRITIQGEPTLIAAQVNQGGKILRLRDNRGFPLWAGPK